MGIIPGIGSVLLTLQQTGYSTDTMQAESADALVCCGVCDRWAVLLSVGLVVVGGFGNHP